MKCFRILPDMCASTLRCPGRSTRNIVPGNTWVTVPSVTICSSFDTRGIYARTFRSQLTRRLIILAQLIPRNCWQILTKLLAFPPGASLPAFFGGCEAISVKHRPDVLRRFVVKRVIRQQMGHICRAFQEPGNESDQPRILLRTFQSSKPHLPIESGLMRCAPSGRAF